MSSSSRRRKPSDPFIVLRPIPSRRWKQKAKQAARQSQTTLGKYLIRAVERQMREDGVLEPEPSQTPTPPAPAAAAE